MIGIDPLYFWDEMSQDEVIAIYKAKDKEDRRSWEQVRLQSYYSIVAFRGTEQYKKPEDLFRFSWEKKEKKSTKDQIIKKAVKATNYKT